MSSMVSRWPVLITVPVRADELDAGGLLTRAAVERVFAEARAVYFGQCASLEGATVEIRRTEVALGRDAVRGGAVTVSTGVVEVFPDAFTMTARIRALGDGGIAAEASCTLSSGGPLPTACRDEFIALAHGAVHID